MGKLRLVVAVSAGFAVFAAPQAAIGAVTIGQSTGTPNTCGTPQTQVQRTTVGGASYVAPSGGVITSWKYRSHNNPQPQVRVKVYDPVGDPATTTSWFLRSQSPLRTPTIANDVNPFTESPGIPIQAGDHVGLGASGALTMQCFQTAQIGDATASTPSDTALGNHSLTGGSTFQRVAVEATIEPDADGDQFGDETQDQCSTDPTTQGACTADVAITNVAAPEPVARGSDLTYTLTATNNNPSGPAGNVVVTDPIPGGATLRSSTPSQGSCAGDPNLGCNIGTLGPGASATVQVVVTPTTAGVLSNTATVQSSTPDPNPANNSATATSTVNAGGGGAGPNGELSAKRKQDVDKLRVKATFDTAAALRGQASVGVSKAKRAVKSKPATANVAADESATLRLKFSKKALKAIKAAIANGKRPKAKINVTATDAGGSSSTVNKTVRLTD